MVPKPTNAHERSRISSIVL